jgi:hypothetical protein
VFAITALLVKDFVCSQPPLYIPKGQPNRTSRLIGQWLLVQRSWIKPIKDHCSGQRRRWKHRWKYAKLRTSEMRHSPKPTRTFMILAMSTIGMSAEAGHAVNRIFPIDIDNRSTANISHFIESCVLDIVPTDKLIEGFPGSQVFNVTKGTIKWKWADEEGKVYKFVITDSYYAPTTAKVYVDQATGLGYVHLQKSTSAEETVESKKAFEAYARSHGISILLYQADNGIFKANSWLEATTNGQLPGSSWQQKCGFVTENTNKSDNSLPPKVPSPRQATPATQRDPSEGEDTNKSDNSLPPEASSPRQVTPAT